jgi:hypothetical protein
MLWYPPLSQPNRRFYSLSVSRETSVILSVAAVLVWLIGYASVLFATRHRPLIAAPSNVEPVSPAVVSLLVNDFESGDEVVEATALDLVSRNFLDYRDRIMHVGSAYPTRFSDLEQQVYDRAAAGWGRTAPKGWVRSAVALAHQEARDAGLAKQRFDQRMLLWLGGSAALTAIVAAGSILWATGNASAYLAGLLLIVTFGGLIAAGQRLQHTQAGRVVGSHWLARRDSPPSPGYAVALGVHEGLGDGRTLIWSHGRRVRVKYPSGWDRYGRSAADLFRQAAQRLLVGGALVYFWRIAPVLVIGGYLILRGIYLLARNAFDVVSPRGITGTVLRIEPWRGPRRDLVVWRVPHVAYCVIDDGYSAVLTAWALPSTQPRPEPGDTVRVRARRWSRRLTDVSVAGSGGGHRSGTGTHRAVVGVDTRWSDEGLG